MASRTVRAEEFMAKSKQAPAIPSDIPASGQTIINDITFDTIWKDKVFQYYYGDNTMTSLDPDFLDLYNDDFSPAPDAVYGYAALTKRAFQMIDNLITTDFRKTNNVNEADEV